MVKIESPYVSGWGYRYGAELALRKMVQFASHGTIWAGPALGFQSMVSPRQDRDYGIKEYCIYNLPFSLGRALKFIHILSNPNRFDSLMRRGLLLLIHEDVLLRGIATGLCDWRSIYQTPQHDPTNPKYRNKLVKRPYSPAIPVETHWRAEAFVPARDFILFTDPAIFHEIDVLNQYSGLCNSPKICITGRHWNFSMCQNGYSPGKNYHILESS